MSNIRKGASIILAAMVLFFAVVAVLGIWGIIDVEKLFMKSVQTLVVLFVAAAILLFLFAVVFKSGDSDGQNNRPQPPPLQ